MTIFRWAFAVTVGTALVGAPAVLAGVAFWAPDREALLSPDSGMALLNSYRCRRGETRRILVKGTEDDFSPEGTEPSHRHERLSASVFEGPGISQTPYDQPGGDGYVLDHFALPRNVARGLFVISLKPVLDSRNDTLMIGDFSGLEGAGPVGTSPLFYAPISSLGSLAGWRRSGSLVWAPFADIWLRPNVARRGAGAGDRSLLDHVRTSRAGVLDVRVSDDTAVDFMGVAYCEEPRSHGGLTFAIEDTGVQARPPVLWLTTHAGVKGRTGDPFLGDTDCDVDLPLLCFRDEQKPAPEILSHFRSNGTHKDGARHWMGGSIRLSSPVRASAFATVADADRRCSDEFGPRWRVADLHAGGSGTTLAGLGPAGAREQRAWIDIKDQPYGACWNRAPQ